MAKILIVDDDPQAAEQIASQLKGKGHSCAVMSDGEGVVDVARKTNLDLLILDVMLPGTSGFEVCRRIRKDDVLYMLPILFVSSMSDDAEVQHGLEQGADGYVSKPIESQAFLQRVELMLRSREHADYTDPVTGFPDNEGTRRLIQQHITRDDPFSLIYIETLHLKDFTGRTGIDGRDKALRHMARALHLCAETLQMSSYAHGHLGGGYFICMTPIDMAEAYCNKVMKSWHKHMIQFYNSPALKVSYEEAVAQGEVLDLTMCVTYRVQRDHSTAAQLLETVSKIHKTANIDGEPGIHIDRRVL